MAPRIPSVPVLAQSLHQSQRRCWTGLPPGPVAGLELLHICRVKLRKSSSRGGRSGTEPLETPRGAGAALRTAGREAWGGRTSSRAALRPEINAALTVHRGRRWLIFSKDSKQSRGTRELGPGPKVSRRKSAQPSMGKGRTGAQNCPCCRTDSYNPHFNDEKTEAKGLTNTVLLH